MGIIKSKPQQKNKLDERSEKSDSFAYSPTKEKETNFARFITAEHLINTAAPDLKWLIHGLIAYGATTLFCAHPKTGKTTLLYHSLRALLNNDADFLSRALDFKGNILLLTEEPYSILKAKFQDLGLGGKKLFVLQRSKIGKWDESIDQIRVALEGYGVTLIVIDTLAAFWNIKDENSAAGIMEPYQRFQALIQNHNAAGIIIHHLRKADADSDGGGKGVRGSNALSAAVDFVIEVKKEKESSVRRKLSIEGRYYPKEELVIELQDNEYIYIGSGDQFSADGVARRVLEFLRFRAGEEFEVEQISVVLNPKPGESGLRKALDKLLVQKAIERKGEGKKGDPHKYFVLKAVKTAPKKPVGVVRKIIRPEGGAK